MHHMKVYARPESRANLKGRMGRKEEPGPCFNQSSRGGTVLKFPKSWSHEKKEKVLDRIARIVKDLSHALPESLIGRTRDDQWEDWEEAAARIIQKELIVLEDVEGGE